MLYEHNGREYEVGVSQAFLRLFLEGCESKLGSVFGESVLEPVIEKDELELKASVGVQAGAAVSSSSMANMGMSASAVARGDRTRTLGQTKHHLPVVALPNDSWEIKAQSVGIGTDYMIQGTAVPSARLCVLGRKQGGNRIVVIGEVQVSKSKIAVVAKGGNRIGKGLIEWRNKDTIVGLILKLAIQREASNFGNEQTASTVAISRCEVLEE